jgi:type IV pilus assembly protein PilP
MRRKNRLSPLLMLAGFLLFAGVGWSAGPADKKAPPPLPPTSAPQAPFSFNPAGKADPFKPFVDVELAHRKRLEMEKKKNLPLSPLQRAGVESFRLLGIAGNETQKTALIADAAGKTYSLSVGTRIGLHNGRVVGIRSDRVLVEEPAMTKGRQAKARIIEMKLRREGEEGRP